MTTSAMRVPAQVVSPQFGPSSGRGIGSISDGRQVVELGAGAGGASAALRAALRRSCTMANTTAPSKSRHIGTAIAHIVNGSVLGVATAANRKIRKIEMRCDLRSSLRRQDADQVGHDDQQRQLEGQPEHGQQQDDERQVAVDGQERERAADPAARDQDLQPLGQHQVGQATCRRANSTRRGGDEDDRCTCARCA